MGSLTLPVNWEQCRFADTQASYYHRAYRSEPQIVHKRARFLGHYDSGQFPERSALREPFLTLARLQISAQFVLRPGMFRLDRVFHLHAGNDNRPVQLANIADVLGIKNYLDDTDD